jgi:hypothetical protein
MKHLLYQLVDCDIFKNPLFPVLVVGQKTAVQSRRAKTTRITAYSVAQSRHAKRDRDNRMLENML